MIPTTLVTGASAVAREQAIADLLDAGPAERTALILEGMPGGHPRLLDDPQLDVSRIAAGCPCCEGNLVLRVTLNRMLRRRPQRLVIALATDTHLDTLRVFLSSPPYADLLVLTKELHAGSRSQ